MINRYCQWLVLALALAPFARAAENQTYTGYRLSSVIKRTAETLDKEIVFSSRLVRPDYLATREPTQADPIDALKEVLSPYGLTLKKRAGKYYVLRDKGADKPRTLIVTVRDEFQLSPVHTATLSINDPQAEIDTIAPGTFSIKNLTPGPKTIAAIAPNYQVGSVTARVKPTGTSRHYINIVPQDETPLEDIIVSTSRYVLSENTVSSVDYDLDTLESFPNVGGDPIRLTQRVPGTAFNSVSAKTHIRGGENNETLLVLDGLELTDPFHLRDYQSLFSAINQRTLDGVQIYTGGFPARYGDILSGVVNMTTFQPQENRHELALSFFNTSYVTSGLFADGSAEWLLSARRGNLDLVVDTVNDALGEPQYVDLLSHLQYYFDEDTSVSFNAFVADDNVLVVSEALLEEREQSETDANNTQVWVALDRRWTDFVTSETIVANTRFENRRTAFSNDPEGVVGNVSDSRTLDEFRIKQDFSWQPSPRFRTNAGFQWKHGRATYDYSAESISEDALSDVIGLSGDVSRSFQGSFNSDEYSAYLSTRMQPSNEWTVELGARWARQDHTPDGSLFSPRLNLLYKINKSSRLRLSLGRFFQSQRLYELQVQDGVNGFFPAQKSDHIIASFEQTLRDNLIFRIEAYDKRLRTPRPRFENLFDPLATIPELSSDRVQVAPDSARAYGVEMSINRDGDGPWNWWSSYTYSKALDTIAGLEAPRNWDQRHAFSGGFSYRKNDWTVSLATNFRSGWPTTQLLLRESIDDEGALVATPTLGARNAARLGSFGSVDLHVAKTFNLRDSKITVSLDMLNLLSNKNECCIEFDVDDEASIVTSEVEHWLPTVPSLGIRWEF